MEHRENAALQRSAMSIENGGHTFRTPAECYVSEITYRSAGADTVGTLCFYKHIAPLEQRGFPFCLLCVGLTCKSLNQFFYQLPFEKVFQTTVSLCYTIFK